MTVQQVKKIKHHHTIILGAGASGLMCASQLNGDVALIDSNPKIATKIEVSGGGKCNITNKVVTYNNYHGDREFVKPAINHFSNTDLLTYLKKHGLTPVLRDNKHYFCKNSSQEIISIFKKETRKKTFYLSTNVTSVEKKEGLFILQTSKGIFSAKHLIVASGGVSFPKLGASDIAYKIAQHFGHEIRTPKPALVGFTVQKEQFWMKELSGLSTPINIKVNDKSFSGNLLFAHKGISGLVILNASLYWDKGSMEMDFLPKKSLQAVLKDKKKQISTQLPLPKRFIKAFLHSINLEDKRVEKLTEKDYEKLLQLKKYLFSPAGNFGFSKAEVTRGGVSTEYIDAKTFMSQKEENLYFIGESLDITGELGGYNFQWAFSSAHLLAHHFKA